MSKYQKWTFIFCICLSLSIIFGQVAKSWFAYATITGWLLGCIFLVLATITIIKG